MLRWQNHLLDSFHNHEVDAELYHYIDDLLVWWSTFPRPEDQLYQTLHQRYSYHQLSKQIYKVFDELLFKHKGCFYGLGNDPSKLKQRYRRLMQVYHPDRAVDNELRINKRAEIINAEYSKYKKRSHKELKYSVIETHLSASPKSLETNFMDMSNLVSNSSSTEKYTSLTPNKLRLRALSCLLLLSITILVTLYLNKNDDLSSPLLVIEADEPPDLSSDHSQEHTGLLLAESDPINQETLAYTQREEVELFIEKWTQAWSSKDIDSYLSFYDHSFTPESGLKFSDWRANRNDALANKRYIRVKTIGLELRPHESGIEAEFIQYYFSDSWVDKVKKRLVLRKSHLGWKIILEQVEIV